MAGCRAAREKARTAPETVRGRRRVALVAGRLDRDRRCRLPAQLNRCLVVGCAATPRTGDRAGWGGWGSALSGMTQGPSFSVRDRTGSQVSRRVCIGPAIGAQFPAGDCVSSSSAGCRPGSSAAHAGWPPWAPPGRGSSAGAWRNRRSIDGAVSGLVRLAIARRCRAGR